MLKIVTAAVTALFLTASTTLAYAQPPSAGAGERLSAADWNTLTDMRINVVRAALQLTPEQEQYWPAIADAIRARAEHRQARIATIANRVAELRNGSLEEALQSRNPIDFLKRRADALAERAADLKKLADAWQPLYQTLTPNQKRRMSFLTILVLRETGNAVKQHILQYDESAED